MKKEFYHRIVMKNSRKIEYIKIYTLIYTKYVKKIFYKDNLQEKLLD